MKIDFSKNTLIITLYDKENIYHIWNTIEEMHRTLCKKLDVDEDDFDEFKEIHLGVDDYYEYLAYRRMILDYTPIYWLWKKNLRFLKTSNYYPYPKD